MCLPPLSPLCAQEIKGGLGQAVAQVSAGGVYIYSPSKWGAVRLYLTNPTDEPADLLAATFFEEEPTLQFGRRVWVPARSRIQTWYPILPPPVAAEGGLRFNIRTLVMDTRHDRDVLIRSDSGYLQLDGNLRAIVGTPVIGIVGPLGEIPDDGFDAPYELLLAMRSEEPFDRQISHLSERLLPPATEILNALDHMVLADDRLLNDPAGMAALRRWLFGGGHLWVMLDRVDPRVLERLMGDEFIGEVVDRVGLTTVRIEPAVGSRNSERSVQDYERPIEFVRTIVGTGEVEFTVDGWPAAVTRNCGEGRLFVTMLGAEGWMRSRVPADDPASRQPPPGGLGLRPSSPDRSSGTPPVGVRMKPRFILLEPSAHLVADFFRPRSTPLLSESKLEPQVQEYVGYTVPSRWIVVGLLIGFSGILAGLGVWLWRLDRLELLGAIGPMLAIAVSVVLVLMGRSQRQSIPAAVASVQFVQAMSGTEDVRVDGVAGLFSPERDATSLKAVHGGWLIPDMTGQQGTTRRLIWTDLDAWQWENLPPATGLRTARLAASMALPERLEARATFGPQGLSGRLRAASARSPADAVLATRDGRMGVELRDDGTFEVRSDNVFAAEQFLAAGLLSDEQHRRRRLLELLLTNPERRDYPSEPQLLFWSQPWDVGIKFDESRRPFGAALVAVPLRLERPPAGTDVTIAAPLLPYRAVFGPDRLAPSGWYDDRRHLWVEKSWPSTTWLRFQIPPVLLPVAMQQARLVVKVKGPVGKLEFSGVKQGQVVPIKSWVDPVGTLTFDINDPELLAVSDDGGLLLRVAGGDPDRPELTESSSGGSAKVSYWQIESLSMDLWARTLAPRTIADEAGGGG